MFVCWQPKPGGGKVGSAYPSRTMHQRTFKKLRSENGFTLIELLVVILVIGILAAIAIPSFLAQKSKSTDAAAKELAHTAQVAALTYGLDNNGYATLTPVALNGVEKTIQVGPAGNNAYISSTSGVPLATASSFEVTATASNGDTFSIIRARSAKTLRRLQR